MIVDKADCCDYISAGAPSSPILVKAFHVFKGGAEYITYRISFDSASNILVYFVIYKLMMSIDWSTVNWFDFFMRF